MRHLDRLTRHADQLERAFVSSMIARAGAVMVEASGQTLDPATLAGELTWVVRSIASAEERAELMREPEAPPSGVDPVLFARYPSMFKQGR